MPKVVKFVSILMTLLTVFVVTCNVIICLFISFYRVSIGFFGDLENLSCFDLLNDLKWFLKEVNRPCSRDASLPQCWTRHFFFLFFFFLNKKSFRQSLMEPEFVLTDFAKMERPAQLHLGYVVSLLLIVAFF